MTRYGPNQSRHGDTVQTVFRTPRRGNAHRDHASCLQPAAGCLRNVEVNGAPVRYVNAGFAPAYWGGFGFGPGLFTGLLLGQAFAPHAFFAPGGDYGGGDHGGGDFGGGDFGGGDFGGGDFGGDF